MGVIGVSGLVAKPGSINVVPSGSSPNGGIQFTAYERRAPPHDEGLMSPPPRPQPRNSRPLSMISRPGSRLSLSLPVQAAEKDSYEPKQDTRPTSESSTRQVSPSIEAATIISPTESGAFLVALAAQERRVFELKEELHRAEDELKKLKRQWALHEANPITGRLRTENQHTELQPMQMAVSNANPRSSERLPENLGVRSLELDRGRVTVTEHSKDTRRKVITGGHTRALSLLSSAQSTYDQSSTILRDSKIQQASNSNGEIGTTRTLKRTGSNRERHSYQDTATIGVKQIAEDIKTGLWTFMEDLRQATVGDEAIKGSSLSKVEKPPGDTYVKGSRRSFVVADQSITRAHGGETLIPRIPENGESLRGSPELLERRLNGSEKNSETFRTMDDDWSNWDSPISKGETVRWSSCTTVSSQDPNHANSPSKYSKVMQKTTVVDPKPEADETPWSPFNNFTTSNIKRTASAIIKEWEKTLTPPPGKRSSTISNQTSGGVTVVEDGESRNLLNNLP